MKKMRPGGIHLLLTYRCNASCEHCFLSCGPVRKGLIPIEDIRKYVADASAAPYINHFFIEGGEPFLYPELLEQSVKEIAAVGYWLGVITNGFWAVTDEKARKQLAPLAAAGLGSLGISTDAWHNQFVPVERAERAARIAGKLGIDADLMVCAGGPDSGPVQESEIASATAETDGACMTVADRLRQDGFEAYTSPIICRGRASSSSACQTETHDWRTLTRCSASFGGTSRIHLGPYGQIHLCQGLLLGRDARTEPLPDIFAGFKVKEHPLCAALQSGGPAALARLAMERGFIPKEKYADGCQLCFEARRHLVKQFPRLLGPVEMYE